MFTFTQFTPGMQTKPASERSDSTTELAVLRSDVERLYFITEALWRILKEKHGLDDVEIIRQITVIDMEDGRLDNRKAGTPPKPCPKCNRVLAKQRMKCLYCGELIAADPFDR